jgi:hypothetical protein
VIIENILELGNKGEIALRKKLVYLDLAFHTLGAVGRAGEEENGIFGQQSNFAPAFKVDIEVIDIKTIVFAESGHFLAIEHGVDVFVHDGISIAINSCYNRSMATHWSVDEQAFQQKSPEKYRVWKLVHMINYGLQGEKLPEKEVKKHWDEIQDQIDPVKKRLLEFLIWNKLSSHKIKFGSWNMPAKTP